MMKERIKKTSEDISSHKNASEIFDCECDDNGINAVNTEEESYVTCIHDINETNERSINGDSNYIHKYYAPFLLSNIHEDLSTGTLYDSDKLRVCCQINIILDLLLRKSKSFE